MNDVTVGDSRFVRTVEHIAEAITQVVKLAAFTIVVVFYMIVGGTIYFAFLAQGILLFSVRLIFKLMAQRSVRPDVRQFQAIIQSWPRGFQTLVISFWKLPPEEVPEVDEGPLPSTLIRLPWFFGVLQISYTVIFCLVIYGLWTGQNPFGTLLNWSNLAPTLIGIATILGGLFVVEFLVREHRRSETERLREREALAAVGEALSGEHKPKGDHLVDKPSAGYGGTGLSTPA